MRLPKPFYKLPVRLDVDRLRAEVAALPANGWVAHPGGAEGNSAVRLISAGGGETDDVLGAMLPTAHLRQSPYMRQILASFGVVWSRSRLMRLAPGAKVREHADIAYQWFYRVRMHMPIVTHPEVSFHCGGQTVHMAAGEVWLFDNWRLHSVDNPTGQERIHFVADTTGGSAFWQFVAQSEAPGVPVHDVQYDPGREVDPLTERNKPSIVMPPAEVDLLLMHLANELTVLVDSPASRAQHVRYRALLDAFRRDWRQLYLLHGDARSGWAGYEKMREGLRDASRQLSEGLAMATNRVGVQDVLLKQVLQPLLYLPREQPVDMTAYNDARQAFSRPIFIVSAPRSGSTLLYETLVVNRQLCNLGGEAHWLIETIPQLQPGAPGVESNRLTEENCSEAVANLLLQAALKRLRQADGSAANVLEKGLRLLEKTPKNALRIPFLNRVFPDARFIFLWRDPRENISSIMDAWRSGNWITYRQLPGRTGPWSMLLPPDWQSLRDKPLEDIAAYQWECTNRTVFDDLQKLPRTRWTVVNYEEFLQAPEKTVRRLCDFAEIDVDAALAQRVSEPLPLSRYTLTPPRSDKWRHNEAEIERVLPGVDATWKRLQALGA